ncbi:MAG: hypothetical protein WC635_11290 [Bacteriovorax sp.]
MTTMKWNILKHKVKSIFIKDKRYIMTDDELIDEALEETFPASDPPGYRSKTHRDKELHQPPSSRRIYETSMGKS